MGGVGERVNMIKTHHIEIFKVLIKKGENNILTMIPPPCKAQLRLGIELKTRVFIQQTQDLSWIPSTEKDFERNEKD